MNRLKDLDSNDQEIIENIKVSLKEQFDHSKESWIMKGVYDYYLISNSSRAVEVITCVKEPHDVHFFDRMTDGLRGSNKVQHLTLLGHIVRRRPIWLFKIASHPVFQELIKLLKSETDIVTVVSALLIINILLPFIPGLLAKHLQTIFAIFSNLAAMNATPNKINDPQLIHLQISLYTLFHRLYGMFPCSFLSFLQTEFHSGSDKGPVFSHTVKPMLDTVRLHPLLITATCEWEVKAERWKNIEPHDIITNCAKLLMSNCDSISSSMDFKPSFDCQSLLAVVKVTGNHSVLDYCGEMSRKSEEITSWSPSTKASSAAHVIESTPTMIPLTPITRGFEVSSPYSEHEGSSPPEAAIEATPETTPSRDYADVPRSPFVMSIANRSIVSFSKESSIPGSKVPISDRSYPSSPVRKEVPQLQFSAPDVVPQTQKPRTFKKINKLMTDRNEAGEDHAIVGAKSIGAKTDLSSTFYHDGDSDLISNLKISILQPSMEPINKRQTNGSVIPVPVGERRIPSVPGKSDNKNGVITDVLDDYEECEQETSGSPCTSGGLHMPDNRSLRSFAGMIRTRYYSQTNSDSVVSGVGGCSTGTSPQEIHDYFNESKVRRTHSCPEMKKSSPSSTFSFSQSDKLSLPEEKEEESENASSNGFDEIQMFEKPELVSSYTQTEEISPSSYPYEHLFKEMFPPLYSSSMNQYSPENDGNTSNEKSPSLFYKVSYPSNILQKYVDNAINCHLSKTLSSAKSNDIQFLQRELKLMSCHLQFEEHRREILAERNRRLLGRSRRNKTLEEHNSALKDQVSLQQQDLENHSSNLQKVTATCASEVAEKQKSEEYWRELYHELEKEYTKISDKCSELDSQLKEEKRISAANGKQIQEGKAALIDITNELRVNQKEAILAKVLRARVAELQSEILKAGETVVRLHRRLSELLRPSTEGLQNELLRSAYITEVNQLKNAFNLQSLSLDSAHATITMLKEELKNKENQTLQIINSIKIAHEEKQKQLLDLDKNYEEMKKLYTSEVCKVDELKHQLNNAKHVNRFQQIPMRSFPEFARNSPSSGTIVSDSGAVNPESNLSKPSISSMKTVEQVKSSRYGLPVKSEFNEGKNEKQDRESTNRAKQSICKPNQPDTTKLWRKGRMECAEIGQLRPSFQNDSDISGNINKPSN